MARASVEITVFVAVPVAGVTVWVGALVFMVVVGIKVLVGAPAVVVGPGKESRELKVSSVQIEKKEELLVPVASEISIK